MQCRWKWVVLWSLWAARLVRQPTTPLRVTGGLLRGAVAHDGSHAYYFAVPYATAQGRFQVSKAPAKWDGIYDAYNEHIRCVQRYAEGMISGIEDCLTLNVYTPLPTSETLRPVMVFFHGGGFRDGSSSPLLYGPEYFVKHDVLLVTVNYRLEILGYLCLNINENSGNMGLKDQVEALKWVKNNIHAFGGDANNVTIFGESAGSASVMYHLMSPMSQGLFHRAIMQSGSAISPWSFQFEPLQTASRFVKQMGYETSDPKEIYEILMNKTAEELLRTRVPRAIGDMVLSENIFVPCVETELAKSERFLTDTPYNLVTRGEYNRVPLIIGYNDAEGYMFVGKENSTTIENFDIYKALPRDLSFPSELDKKETARKLHHIYMGDDEISKETLVKISRYEGESTISFPVVATAELFLKTSDKPVYIYKFCYDGWLNVIKLIFGFSSAPGATHADDLFYMFKPKFPLMLSFLEMEIINRMTSMWTNFAKYGDPTPEERNALPVRWQPAKKMSPKLLVINKHFSEAPLFNEETFKLWNTTYTKFRRRT